MNFFAVLFALLIEQVRPLSQNNLIHHGVQAWIKWVMRNFDAGKPHHGWFVWWLAMLVPCLAVLAVHWALVLTLGWWATALWSVAILYLTLGFRQFSHHFTEIRDALDSGDEDRARQLLAEWLRIDASILPHSEIVRHVIEHSVLAAHRHVFGVLVWYTALAALGLGPVGAVAYRVAGYVYRHALRTESASAELDASSLSIGANKAWEVMDWVPARATALGFAFVGNFEEAIDGWRRHGELSFPSKSDAIVLAAAFGAINVQLGLSDATGVTAQIPQSAHLRAVVGLVWRTVVLWMVFLALITLARLLG